MMVTAAKVTLCNLFQDEDITGRVFFGICLPMRNQKVGWRFYRHVGRCTSSMCASFTGRQQHAVLLFQNTYNSMTF